MTGYRGPLLNWIKSVNPQNKSVPTTYNGTCEMTGVETNAIAILLSFHVFKVEVHNWNGCVHLCCTKGIITYQWWCHKSVNSTCTLPDHIYPTSWGGRHQSDAPEYGGMCRCGPDKHQGTNLLRIQMGDTFLNAIHEWQHRAITLVSIGLHRHNSTHCCGH